MEQEMEKIDYGRIKKYDMIGVSGLTDAELVKNYSREHKKYFGGRRKWIDHFERLYGKGEWRLDGKPEYSPRHDGGTCCFQKIYYYAAEEEPKAAAQNEAEKPR